jgi:hypothetical protein
MNKKTKPQYAMVEQPFGDDPPIIHCPVCGQASMTVDDKYGADVTPCVHLAFIYVGESGGFEYQSKEFEVRMAKLDDDDEEDDGLCLDNFQRFLEKAGYGNEMLAIEISYGGMGHCPVYYSDVFGFDFCGSSQEENE